ncbi:MAG: class I SAM-dependent methyltransferase [Candidatus Nanoarchaeia archaeon]
MKIIRDDNDLSEQYEELVEYYDAIAEGYDELHFEEQKEKFSLIAKHAEVPEGADVLDVGCGTFFSHDFFQKFCAWELQGIEPSARMVSLFQKSHPSLRNKARVGFAEELKEQYNRDSFDAVICVSVVHHFKDPFVVFEQMKHVCRPAGIIVITLLQGVKDFKGLCGAIESAFNVEKRVESRKDVIFICRNE